MTAPAVLRLGTRRSPLARTQSALVASALAERAGVRVELVDVVTEGDISRESLASIGGTGVFASALRTALLAGTIDVAVHSLKDLPTAPAAGLTVAAVPAREDPRDVLVAAGGARLAGLPPGARVGTGSPRRAAQLRAVRPDLRIRDVRGNVDTRLRMVADGRLDAVVLARSGLLRLGRAHEVSEVLESDVMMPAPGQGALAVECREDDAATVAACALLDDPRSHAAVTAERTVLAALEAGCTAPVGALATWPQTPGADSLSLHALVAAPDGSAAVRRQGTAGPTSREPAGSGGGPPDLAAARDLGLAVAADLLSAVSDAAFPPLSAHPTSTPPLTDPLLDHQLDPPVDPHDTVATAPPERVHL